MSRKHLEGSLHALQPLPLTTWNSLVPFHLGQEGRFEVTSLIGTVRWIEREHQVFFLPSFLLAPFSLEVEPLGRQSKTIKTGSRIQPCLGTLSSNVPPNKEALPTRGNRVRKPKKSLQVGPLPDLTRRLSKVLPCPHSHTATLDRLKHSRADDLGGYWDYLE